MQSGCFEVTSEHFALKMKPQTPLCGSVSLNENFYVTALMNLLSLLCAEPFFRMPK